MTGATGCLRRQSVVRQAKWSISGLYSRLSRLLVSWLARLALNNQPYQGGMTRHTKLPLLSSTTITTRYLSPALIT